MDFLSMTAPQVEALPEAEVTKVLAAWVKAKRAELPEALSQSSSKAHARLAKKALYQLTSAGVAVSGPKPSEAPVAIPAASPAVQFEAILSMQLGSGEKAFLAAVPIRGGGVEIFQGIVHDELGLAQLSSEGSNRNTWRKHVATLERDKTTRTMIVPFPRLQLELGRAIALSKRGKTEFETQIQEGLARLGVKEEDPDFVIAPLERGDETGAADGARLHDFFEFTQWLPSEPDLAVLSERVAALKALPLDEAQRTTKSEAMAKEMALEKFTPAVRLLYARRLSFAAELIDSLKRPEEAARVRAESRRLAHSQAPSTFAEHLFVKALKKLPPSIATQLGLKAPK